MGFILACKAFLKALKEPEKAQQFLDSLPAITQKKQETDPSHLRLLSTLQQEGRLIDFLKEDIQAFTDQQIGAAVRKIHHDCNAALEDLVTIRPLRDEQEGSKVQIPKGYDPSEIKVVGNVKGEPPFSGVLIHRGWKAHKRSLPKKTGEYKGEVLCPAEIEIK
jgi:hypothetical protein